MYQRLENLASRGPGISWIWRLRKNGRRKNRIGRARRVHGVMRKERNMISVFACISGRWRDVDLETIEKVYRLAMHLTELKSFIDGLMTKIDGEGPKDQSTRRLSFSLYVMFENVLWVMDRIALDNAASCYYTSCISQTHDPRYSIYCLS